MAGSTLRTNSCVVTSLLTLSLIAIALTVVVSVRANGPAYAVLDAVGVLLSSV